MGVENKNKCRLEEPAETKKQAKKEKNNKMRPKGDE
jgi:hypothetical protein